MKGIVKVIAVWAVASIVAVGAAAQDFPNRPIKFYVGFTPGGSADLVSRYIAQRLGERLGQPIVVEQRLGATGIIAQDLVSKSRPDGYTMILLTGGHPTSAAIKKSLPYDPVEGFGMVSTIIEYPMAIGVKPDSPIKSFPDLLARMRAEPGRITVSSAGTGSLHHLLGEWIKIESRTEAIHVPFKGAAPAFTELLGGAARRFHRDHDVPPRAVQARAGAADRRIVVAALAGVSGCADHRGDAPGHRDDVLAGLGRGTRHAGADRGSHQP